MTAGSGQANRARVRARRAALQAIYQWQLAGQAPRDILAEFIADRELINVDMDYFKELTREIPANHDSIRELIEPLLDRPWDQLDPVERGALLIGTYELMHCPHIPFRVAINEAVELAKMFGAEDGFRFVNGILDKLAPNLRQVETRAG
ncbi:MAG: transcription antitermination factor NusB [Gammaproteobacteria bacterium]|nr:transcription antitermination factor NusB [Gammaproteobacteria bacterium]